MRGDAPIVTANMREKAERFHFSAVHFSLATLYTRYYVLKKKKTFAWMNPYLHCHDESILANLTSLVENP